jgi:DNA-directed RNA polymerase subunit beta'
MFNPLKSTDFDAIKLKLASPEQILKWSHGETTRPETINYRTQKPEKDGLFCEKIFGPSKDWECYCGKYRKIRYKGIICDKCGVEVTRSIVRRERMGHIALATPVTHIWFLRGVPSRVGLILNMSVSDIEKVVYFANFIITKVDDSLKQEVIEQLKTEYKTALKKIENDFKQATQGTEQDPKNELEKLNRNKKESIDELDEMLTVALKELKDLKPLKVISENTYQNLSLKFGHIFEAGIGAEAVYNLLKEINLEEQLAKAEEENKESKTKALKNVRRVKLITSLIKNKIKPEWMISKIIPVIPPDLRPMVPLDGGRFATADLNDLYRRVINRNNRLKQLLKLNAPEVICRNEKRMLQEAVDSLIDNSVRHGKTVTASTGQKRQLKSIADVLKGKQGRFRQNLLGKRIDYSGRSVIVVGPNLKLDECGIPKRMALELFKPFVMSQLINRGFVHNVRSASKYIETDNTEVWDILEEIINDSYVMINRAPTLHRLSIQAFKPILIEGKAIQIHPMVCTAFNADFDGDQMAVHVPLTDEARWEAKHLMLATNNLLKPATGFPVVRPSQDIVWGLYYLTMSPDGEFDKVDIKTLKTFSNIDEAILAYKSKKTKLQELIRVAVMEKKKQTIITTTIGRLIFNQIIPEGLPFYNEVMKNQILGNIVKLSLMQCGKDKTVLLLDNMKTLGFEHISKSGLSWSMGDLPEVHEKKGIIELAEKEVVELEEQYEMGLLTKNERHQKIIQIWAKVKENIVKVSSNKLDPKGPVFSMIDSGARGSWSQLIQMIGLKGLVVNPSGDIIELPVKGSFKEGFDVLEFFISTHGARKGLSDTALRTASAGYLTRRLVDVSQEVIIREDDCGDTNGFIITKAESDEIGASITDRIIGRYAVDPIVHPKTGKTIIEAGQLIEEGDRDTLEKIEIDLVKIRSVISCQCIKGVCAKCYGLDLAFNKLVNKGVAVGVIAAQSIGEPGTQLTMRTFHTGGVAGTDITKGLPRVEEIFEARQPKMKAFLSEMSGKVKIEEAKRVIKNSSGEEIMVSDGNQKIIKISYNENEEVVYKTKKDYKVKVKKGENVQKDQTVFITKGEVEVGAKEAGQVTSVEEGKIVITSNIEKVMEYVIPQGYAVLVKNGDLVEAGDQLTEGSIEIQQMFLYKSREIVQKYIIKEIQSIYFSQGQKLNDKHIEIIAKQMFSRVIITEAGDSHFLPGDVVEKAEAELFNRDSHKNKKSLIKFDQLLLGITKISLSNSSWLASASFQETQRVLINAAITGRVDKLENLKENVIIGRLIPVGTGFKGNTMEGLEEMRKRPFIRNIMPKEVEVDIVPEIVADTAEIEKMSIEEAE